MTDESQLDASNAVAVIGMAGRFPGARNLAEYWRNLREGVESVTRFSAEELVSTVYTRDLVDKPNYVRASCLLEDIDKFDAGYFGLSPREAQAIDPQQRIFLECAVEALEVAGYDPARVDGLVGVYAGCDDSTYFINNLLANNDFLNTFGPFHAVLSSDKDFLPTRVSYELNLKGPSLSLQCACSTGLAAVHMAAQSLLSYECDLALAGAVTVKVPQTQGYLYQEGGVFSPDGHCRPFDASAGGFVEGSGAGVVVLKRLADALRDGDTIDAVVKGSALNNDGHQKLGFTAPKRESQAEVIALAQATAQVDPETVTYIEAHGTGTRLGDPLEFNALVDAFRAGTQARGFCGLGSVKSNIGHLYQASGMASLIKTVLALKHAELPPTLNFQSPNPEIDLEASPFYLVTELKPWPRGSAPRRAGVSAFGIGGTNGHIVLEEAPPRPASGPSRPWQLLLLSAKTASALEAAGDRLRARLEADPELPLADAAFTLQLGRSAHAHRRMVVCRDTPDALRVLATDDPKRSARTLRKKGDRRVAFLFTGQGAQYVDMGKELYRGEPTFRASVDRSAELLAPHLGLDLRQVLYPAAGGSDEAEAALKQTALTQPALFVVELALAHLLQEWGIRPWAMMGHSIGEYVAACLAGVWSLKDALALVAARGRLMQSLAPGAMLAAFLPEAEIAPLLGDDLSLAAVNAPALTVVSGPEAAVAGLEERLAQRGVSVRRLRTSHAFHSQMMDPILDTFTRRVAQARLAPPAIPFVSNVTGTWIRPEEATDPAYWARHLRSAVRFADGVATLAGRGEGVLLEVGPGNTLASLAAQHPAAGSASAVLPTLRHPHEPEPDQAFLLASLGRLWLAGVEVDWQGFARHEQRQRIPMPTYPFERKSYWVDPQGDTAAAERPRLPSRLAEVDDWFWLPSWRRAAQPVLDLGRTAEPGEAWLVLGGAGGLGERLARRLEEAGRKVVRGRAAERFAASGDGVFDLRPGERGDYDALLKQLRQAGSLPSHIVHLFALDGDGAPLSRAALGAAEDRAFYSLLHLGQALERHLDGAAVRLLAVTSALHDVLGGEPVRPAQALVLGPVKVLPQEYLNVSATAADVPLPAPGSAEEGRLVDRLLAEAATVADAVVAYRGPHRWVQDFAPQRIESAGPGASRLVTGGVYLITGGLGGVGLALAELLAERAAARLVLTARRPLPPPAEWDAWLESHPADDRTSRQIRTVQALERKGSEVLVASADVADLDEMRRVVAAARQRFGRIDGVIHAAGVAGGGVISLKSRDAADAVFAPKLEGTLVLDEVLADAPPSLFVLCSSRTALVPELGQVDYCSANAFLDAYAHARAAARPGRTVAINWDTWREVGMAVDTEVPAELEEARQENLKLGMLTRDAQEAFVRLLGAESPQVIVATMDFPALVREKTEHRAAARFAEAVPATARRASSLGRSPRPELGTPFVEPRTELEGALADIWGDLLGVDRVGVHDRFFELGGHSLMATGLLSKIEQLLGHEIPVQTLFAGPTVAELAEYVETRRWAGGEATEGQEPDQDWEEIEV